MVAAPMYPAAAPMYPAYPAAGYGYAPGYMAGGKVKFKKGKVRSR